VGAEFSIKQIPIEDTNAVVELYIFDSAGQSIFNQVEMNSKYVSQIGFISLLDLLPAYFHPVPFQWENASAVMCVFDISNRESLNSCAKWLTGNFRA
jgi:transport family protein 27